MLLSLIIFVELSKSVVLCIGPFLVVPFVQFFHLSQKVEKEDKEEQLEHQQEQKSDQVQFFQTIPLPLVPVGQSHQLCQQYL